MDIKKIGVNKFQIGCRIMDKHELLSLIKESLREVDIDIENEEAFFDFKEIRQEEYDEGFQEGLDDSQDAVYERGWDLGHDAGYESGLMDKEKQVHEVLSEVEEIHCLKTAGGAPIKYENIVDELLDIHDSEKK